MAELYNSTRIYNDSTITYDGTVTAVQRTATGSGTSTQTATRICVRVRTGTGTGTGTETSNGVHVLLRTSTGNGLGTQTADWNINPVRTATGSGTGTQTADWNVNPVRQAVGSGFGSSFADWNINPVRTATGSGTTTSSAVGTRTVKRTAFSRDAAADYALYVPSSMSSFNVSFNVGHGWGQSFLGNGRTLDTASFYGSIGPTIGSVTAYIYAHSGVYGSSSLPTGSPLATSDPRSSSLSTLEFKKLTFSGTNRITLEKGTPYVVIFINGTNGSGTYNYGTGNNGSVSGNRITYNGSTYTARATQDQIVLVTTAQTTSRKFTVVSGSGSGSGSGSSSPANWTKSLIFRTPSDNEIALNGFDIDTPRTHEVRVANNLLKFYRPLPRGRNVYKLKNGTLTEREPIADDIAIIYLGGHDNLVTPEEKADLIAAGYTVT